MQVQFEVERMEGRGQLREERGRGSEKRGSLQRVGSADASVSALELPGNVVGSGGKGGGDGCGWVWDDGGRPCTYVHDLWCVHE